MTIDVGADAAHALLTDGTIVLVRPAYAEDEPQVRAMHEAMSPESRRMRFFSSGTATISELSRRICAAPSRGHQALLAVLDDEVIGAASYDTIGRSDVAEVALAVADQFQGKGVGTLLLEHLASRARRNGVTTFYADVLPDNHAMLRVFSDIGLRPQQRVDRGMVEVTIPLTPDDRYLDAVGMREAVAGQQSLQRLLRPASVVVIGGTRRQVSVGNAILRNIRASGFTGRLYAVHPHAAAVADVSAVPSVADLPEVPDLAVVSVPPDAVLDVARACGEQGVGALVVITADLDTETSQELLAVCRRHGMRLVGPNCFGVASLSDGVRLQATFAAEAPRPGQAGLVVQSGGIGITLLEHLSRLDVGISSFVSTGNKLDVSSNDLLQWWEDDPDTAMAIMHVESFGNPRKFSRIARRLGRRKPILTVVAGRSTAGQRAAASHTGASLTPALTTESLFEQAGVVAARSLDELVGTAAFLAHQPLPSGPRVAIVTNAGGTGVLAADACADVGLEVHELSEEVRRELEELLPAGAACANPIDTTPAASSDQLRACLERLAAAAEVDAIIAIMVRTALADPLPVVATMAGGVPVAAVAPHQAEAVTLLSAGGHSVPSYNDPRAAAAALGHAWRRARWLARPAGSVPSLRAVAVERARDIVQEFLKRHPEGGWLPLDQTMEVLGCYGVTVAPWQWTHTPEESVRAWRELNSPVALKADVAGVVHKKRAGALRLDLSGAEQVRNAHAELISRFGSRLRGVLVQAMAPRGFEVLLGLAQQPVFGPVLVCGLGGTYTEALRTRAARLAPLTDVDAAEWVRSVPALRTLGEGDEEKAVDLDALRDMALRLSQLAVDLPQVSELDMNPVLATPSSAMCVDARIRVTVPPSSDPYLRSLRPL